MHGGGVHMRMSLCRITGAARRRVGFSTQSLRGFVSCMCACNTWTWPLPWQYQAARASRHSNQRGLLSTCLQATADTHLDLGVHADNKVAAMAASSHDQAADGAGAADLLVQPAARLPQAHLRLGQLPRRALGQRRIPRLRYAACLCQHHARCTLCSLCGRSACHCAPLS